jgi:hypothetical protein
MFCLLHWYTELVPLEPLICFLYSDKWRGLTACCQSVELLRVSVKVGSTCNITAYRNAVTLQATDTRGSYDLNFHPVPHGVTVSCEHYTMGFPVCYGSHKVRGADGGDVSRCTSRSAQAITYHPFDATAKYRQHTEHARNVTV